MNWWAKRAVVAATVVAIVAAAGLAYYRHHYPFGSSHCCDKQLMFALLDFARIGQC
jgi:hypothetical protein